MTVFTPNTPEVTRSSASDAEWCKQDVETIPTPISFRVRGSNPDLRSPRFPVNRANYKARQVSARFLLLSYAYHLPLAYVLMLLFVNFVCTR